MFELLQHSLLGDRKYPTKELGDPWWRLFLTDLVQATASPSCP